MNDDMSKRTRVLTDRAMETGDIAMLTKAQASAVVDIEKIARSGHDAMRAFADRFGLPTDPQTRRNFQEMRDQHEYVLRSVERTREMLGNAWPLTPAEEADDEADAYTP
jgi:hypothetical protein